MTLVGGDTSKEQMRAELLMKLFERPDVVSAVVLVAEHLDPIPFPDSAEFPVRPIPEDGLAKSVKNCDEAAAWGFDRILTGEEKTAVDKLFHPHKAEWVEDPEPYRPHDRTVTFKETVTKKLPA